MYAKMGKLHEIAKRKSVYLQAKTNNMLVQRNSIRTSLLVVILLACLSVIQGCQSKSKNSSKNTIQTALSTSSGLDSLYTPMPLSYARGYSVRQYKNIHLVNISDPQRKKATIFRLAIVPRSLKDTKSLIPQGYKVIYTPVRRLITMTSLQLSTLIKLKATERVVGVTSTRHLFNQKIKAQLASGTTQHIGIEGQFDKERIMLLQPDIILISPFKRGGYDSMKDIGVPLVPYLGYKEMSPLAQAEWLKFVGLLINKETQADSIFKGMEQEYLSLLHLTKHVKNRPEVFSGEMRGGHWYAVGGKSFLAQLFEDAGAEYFMHDNPKSGGILLDFETIYSRAAHVPYWRIVNSYQGNYDYDALLASNARYADFDAYKNHGVIYCNMSKKPYYEQMPMEPCVLLKDMIKVFHPELLPNYTPVYYSLLK